MKKFEIISLRFIVGALLAAGIMAFCRNTNDIIAFLLLIVITPAYIELLLAKPTK